MMCLQEKTMMRSWGARVVALAMFMSLAVGASSNALAQNAIQSITSSQQAGVEIIRVEMTEPLAAVPNGFSVQTPPRVAIDLPGVVNGLGKSSVDVNQGNIRSVSLASAN